MICPETEAGQHIDPIPVLGECSLNNTGTRTMLFCLVFSGAECRSRYNYKNSLYLLTYVGYKIQWFFDGLLVQCYRTMADPDAYYRVYKALHLVTHEAIPSVDNCLSKWHAIQQQSLPPCSVLGPLQCPAGKKPKAPKSFQQLMSPASCKECEAWGNAVEAMLFHPSTTPLAAKPHMTWQNISPSNLAESHVEVAKAFVLRLQKDIQYNKLEDFDSASLLMIMAKFKEFHKSDQTSCDIISKVNYNNHHLIIMKEELHPQPIEHVLITFFWKK